MHNIYNFSNDNFLLQKSSSDKVTDNLAFLCYKEIHDM